MLRLWILLAVLLTAPLAQATDTPPAPSDAVFQYIPPAWLPELSFSLSPVWQMAGFPERGTTYYTSAAPLPGDFIWDRFNPQSDRYQAWFSAYVITDFAFANEWTRPHLTVHDIPNSIQRLLALMTVDQLAWLTAYGDPSPAATILPGTVTTFQTGDRCFWTTYRMATHSDVGNTAAVFPWYPAYATHASEVAPYAPVTVDVLVRFTYNTNAHALQVVFLSETEWTTKDGVRHTTPPKVALEQLTMLAFTTFP